MKPIDKPTPAGLREALNRIRQEPDPLAARLLIQHVHQRLQRQDPLDPEALAYLQLAFGRLAEAGMDPAAALGLGSPQPSQSSGTAGLREQGIALIVEYQQRFDPYRGARKRAYLIAAERFGISGRHAADIHAAQQAWLNGLSDEELRHRLAMLQAGGAPATAAVRDADR